MRGFVRVHLVDGTSLDGNVNDVTEEEFINFKQAIGKIMEGSGGWQINIEMDKSWAIFPKQSVLFVEMVEE